MPSSISVIDVSTNTVSATISIPGFGAASVVGAPDGKHVYTAGQSLSNGEGQVFVIDTSNNTVVNQIPVSGISTISLVALAITPDGKTLFVTTPGNVVVIDTTTNSVTTRINVPGGEFSAYRMAVAPNGSRLYVTITSFSPVIADMVVIDTATLATVATVSGLGFPSGLAISPDGAFVYTLSSEPNEVFVISTASNTVVKGPIPVDISSGPFAAAFTPDGSFLYLAIPENTVAVMDTASNTITKQIPVGSDPEAVAATPDGASVYVVNNGSDTVTVISTATNTVAQVIPVKHNPLSIAILTLATPFAEFKIQDLDVDGHNFTVAGSFVPGAGSSGINPAKQEVTLTVADFSLTIPAGSFKADHDNDNFTFRGRVKDVEVEFTIRDEQSEREERHGTAPEFKFSAEVREAELGRQSSPVTVSLKIGNNDGTTSVKAR